MIIEGVNLSARRLPRVTFLFAGGGTQTVPADNTRRRIMLVSQNPHLATMCAWSGNLKRTASPSAPVQNVPVMLINESFPQVSLDIEEVGNMIYEAFSFVPDPASVDAYVWEWYNP